MTNKYAGRCRTCQVSVPALAGHLAGRGDDGRWRIECSSCRSESPDAAGAGDDFDARYQAVLKAEQEHLILEAEAMRAAERIRREQAATDEVFRVWEENIRRFLDSFSAETQAPDCMRILGVDPPYTLDAIRRQFRIRAKEAHPDHGGSAPEFIKIRRAYSHALQIVGENP